MLTLIFGAAHYLYLGLLVLMSYLIGRRLTHAAEYDSLAEEVAICTALGLAALAYTVFGLALLGWLRPGITLAALALLLLATYPVWPRFWRGLRGAMTDVIPRLLAAIKDPTLRWVVLLACIMALPLLILPLYPPAAYDATMYHLPFARLFIEQGGLTFATNLRYPIFPQFNEMLFTLVLMFYDDVAPQMVQFLSGLLTALALYAAGRRFLAPRVGVWAAAFWVGSPLIVWIGSSAYVDVGMTLFITLGLYGLGAWLQTRETRWAVLAGVFAGCGAGSKYLALFFLGVMLVVMGVTALRQRRLTHLGIMLAVAALVALPWYGRIMYFTGNPLFPFYSQVFGHSEWTQEGRYSAGRSLMPGEPANPDTPVELIQRMVVRAFGRVFIRPEALLMTPWRLAMDASYYGGEGRLPVNPLLLLTAPVMAWAFFVDTRVRGLLIIVIAYTLFWQTSWPVTRYFMPGLPLLCLAAAIAIHLGWQRLATSSVGMVWQERLKSSLQASPLKSLLPKLMRPPMLALLSFLLIFGPGSAYGAYCLYRAGPLPVTHAARDAYLARRLPLYAAYQLLNDTLDRDYTLYTFTAPNLHWFVEGQVYGDLYGPLRYSRFSPYLNDGPALYDEMRSLGVEYVLTSPRYPMPKDPISQQLFKRLFISTEGALYELTAPPSATTQ